MDRFFFIASIVCLSILLLLFFPIYIKTDGYYDMNGRKFGFSVCLYRFIRLLGGYIATYSGGLAVHLSPSKAILIPYKELDKERRRFSIIRTFHLKKLNATVETGAEYLLPTALMQITLRVIFFALGGKKESIENNLWLTDGDVLRISINFTVRFNLFTLLIRFIYYLKERVLLLCRKKIKNSTI